MSGWLTNGVTAATLPFTGNELLSLDTELAAGVNPQTEAASLTQLAAYFGGNLPMVTGRFYGIPQGSTQAAYTTITATLYAYPIYVPNTVTVTTLSVGCTTGQTGGACHMGIYADNGAGYPGALVYDSGAVAGLTTAVVVTNTPAAALRPTLKAGWYWLASIFTASGTFPDVTASTAIYASALNAQIGSTTAALALTVSADAVSGISVAGTYGALPTTFTAAAAPRPNLSTPVIILGV